MCIMNSKTVISLVAGASLSIASVASGYDVGAVSNGGSISGSITFAGDAPEAKPIEATKDAKVCAQTQKYDESLIVGENKAIKNAVISISNITAGKDFGEAMPLDQKECVYTPHIVLTPAGSELEILNNDGILHNIHTYSEANPAFNQAQPKFKKKLKKKFDHPEYVKVTCDAHNWMTGWIVVMDHPYYAVTDGAGQFSLSDVPAGEYEVKIWHETLGETMQKVTVEAGSDTSLAVELSQS